MTKFLTTLVIFITCVSLLWASDDRGIGGTGKCSNSEDRGLGGTGKYSNSEDRGLGGTGKTVVIGTISAFGSIWVNGIEIEFNQNTDIKMDGKNAQDSSLRVGQQVQVLTSQINKGWYAETILIDHALIGRLEKDANQDWNIQGVTIKMDPNIPGEWPDLKQNDYVKVSGYFDQHVFYATDIAPTIDNNTWKISAPVLYSTTGKWTIGGHELPSDVLDAKNEETITLEGKYTSSGNRLTRIFYHKDVPFAHQSTHYIVEKRRPSHSESIEYSPEAFKQSMTPTQSNTRVQNPTSPRSSFFNSQPSPKSSEFGAWESSPSNSMHNKNNFGHSGNGSFGSRPDTRSNTVGAPPSRVR